MVWRPHLVVVAEDVEADAVLEGLPIEGRKRMGRSAHSATRKLTDFISDIGGGYVDTRFVQIHG